MSAKPIELILLRQLAGRLPMPVALVDAGGSLIYVNPATERLLGLEQAEIGEYPASRLNELLDPRRPDGSAMAAEDIPIVVALHGRRPQQTSMIIHGVDGTPHHIMTTALPLDGQGGALLGSMSVFWEVDGDG